MSEEQFQFRFTVENLQENSSDDNSQSQSESLNFHKKFKSKKYSFSKNNAKQSQKLIDKNKEVIINKNLVNIQFFGKPKCIEMKDFFTIPYLISSDHKVESAVKEIFHCLEDDNQILLLNVFLYYCIKIRYDVNLQGIETYYQKIIRNSYISLNMNVDISKYAQLCSSCLPIYMRQSAHIIYYLVYGRLATQYFIETLVGKFLEAKQEENNKIAKFSNKDVPSQKTNQPFPKQNEIFRKNELVEELTTDLKQIFSPSNQPEREKGRKKLETTNHEEDSNNRNWLQWEGTSSEKKYFNSFYPNRILNHEKSAIMQLHSKRNKTPYKFMRRKKFDYSGMQKMLQKSMINKSKTQFKKAEQKMKGDNKKQFNLSQNIVSFNERYKNDGQEFDRVRKSLKSGLRVNKKGSTQHLYKNQRKKNQSQNYHERMYFRLMTSRKLTQPTQSQNLINQSTFTDSSHQQSIKQEQSHEFACLLKKNKKNFKKTKQSDDENLNMKSFMDNKTLSTEKSIDRKGFSATQNRICKYKKQFSWIFKRSNTNINN